jgi:NADH dehydrogenase/NADH:ubiquinone oxidoreductase subunit G
MLGSSTDLTFPSTVIGTNLKVLKEIAEGNNFACQDFKTAKNPLLIFGNEFYKRTDGKKSFEMFKILQNANVFNQNWNGLNSLNSTLSEVGTQSIANFLPLKKKDFTEFSSLYFINVNAYNVPNLKKITETKLLNYTNLNGAKQLNINTLFLDQNSNIKNNQIFAKHSLKLENNYNFLPVKMFYENKETFLNTEGLIKKTNKLITRRKTREGWKLLRNLLTTFKHKYTSLNSQNNNILVFNATKQVSFLNFLNFHYCAVEKLESCTPSLATQNQPFYISQTNTKFKQKISKITHTKTKYWIDDFFTGGKDEYSKNSLVLANCSKILRTQSTNFF